MSLKFLNNNRKKSPSGISSFEDDYYVYQAFNVLNYVHSYLNLLRMIIDEYVILFAFYFGYLFGRFK